MLVEYVVSMPNYIFHLTFELVPGVRRGEYNTHETA
jgi:hypothetical protein